MTWKNRPPAWRHQWPAAAGQQCSSSHRQAGGNPAEMAGGWRGARDYRRLPWRGPGFMLWLKCQPATQPYANANFSHDSQYCSQPYWRLDYGWIVLVYNDIRVPVVFAVIIENQWPIDWWAVDNSVLAEHYSIVVWPDEAIDDHYPWWPYSVTSGYCDNNRVAISMNVKPTLLFIYSPQYSGGVASVAAASSVVLGGANVMASGWRRPINNQCVIVWNVA